MSVVLSTKYIGQPIRVFYLSRILRLYPSYFIVLALTLALAPFIHFGIHKVSYGFAYMFSDGVEWSLGNLVLWTFTNLVMLGKEIWFFNGGNWVDVVAPGHETIMRRLNTYQIVSPAWSLSLELQFYLLAPFLARARTGIVVLLCVLSVALRAGLQFWGYAAEPYAYYTLPCQLCLFLLGMLSHRLLGKWTDTAPMWSAHLASIGLCSLLVFYPWTSAYAAIDWIKLIMLALLFFTVPLLAKTRSAADRYMGDLSYPVYLLHLPVIYVIAANWPPEWPSAVQAALLFAVVLVLSAALVNFVDRPVDRLRQRWATGAVPGRG